MKKNIRIKSGLVDYLKMCLLLMQKRKIYILVFLASLPMFILVWTGLLESLAFCLFFCFLSLFMFINSFTEASIDYSALFLFLFFLGCICATFPYFKALRASFKSGEILIEQLLPVIGAVLWLLVLIGVAIWLNYN